MEIVQESLPEERCTVFTVTGQVELQEIMNTISAWYQEGMTRNVLWDLRGADLSCITSRQLQKMAAHVETFAHQARGGRTAMLMSGDEAFGLGQMYEVMTGLGAHPTEHRVFYSRREAFFWLTETPKAPPRAPFD